MTTSADPYRTLGRGYATVRRPDERITRRIRAAVGPATTVLNVGAGTGSYEPDDCAVIAVEPSATMIGQRPEGAAPVVQAGAEDLPFADGQFDVAMAILTVHHWTDPVAGLAELRRVSRRQVVLTWDPAVMARMWLIAQYLPEVAAHERRLATSRTVVAELRQPRVDTLEVPADCTDGFLAANWRRPHRYLQTDVRAGASGIARQPEGTVRAAMHRLAGDLDSGTWQRRNVHLLALDTYDAGYRLITAG